MGHDAENQDRGRCVNWESELSTTTDEETEQLYISEEDCLANTKPIYDGDRSGKHYNKCDFTYNYTFEEDGKNKSEIWDKCKLFAQEGYAYNIYMCKAVLLD